MKKNKILLFVVLLLLVCMPFASAQLFGPTDVQYSPLANQLSLEEMVLYGGLKPSDIDVQGGVPCIKPGAEPGLTAPDPIDLYLVPLNELQLPMYGLAPDLEYLRAQNKRLHEIIDMVDAAVNDESVQQYKEFSDSPIFYENTDYGMYFTTIYDSLVFGGEALKIIGQLHDSATEGAMWLNYGFITDSADVRMSFKDYTEMNLMFNGLMGQMQEYGYLEEAVGYAANVLGSQMSQQAQAGNNVFQAHENLDIAGDSLDRANDFFDIGDAAGAVGKPDLENRMDFFGLMNMAEGLYSMGESYKLKMLVLFMLLDGTFRDGVGMQRKIGVEPTAPCDKEPVNICPISGLAAPGTGDPPAESHEEQCCEGCPPGYYIIDQSNIACFGGGITRGTPGYFPTPGGSPGPSVMPGMGGPSPTGGAVVGSEEDTAGIFPIFRFRLNEAPDLSGWPDRIPNFPAVPEEYEIDEELLVQENAEAVGDMREAMMLAAGDVKVNPSVMMYQGRPVSVVPEQDRVVVKDEEGNAVAAINTNAPDAVALALRTNPEQYVEELAGSGLRITPETLEYNGKLVQLNTQTGELVDVNGNVVSSIGEQSAHDFEMYGIAQERLNKLNEIVEIESNKQPIYEKDRQTYLEQKREELTIQLDAIEQEYKFQVREINADPDLLFEQRNDKLVELYDRTNEDLIRAIEGTITDERVRKFTYLIPEEEETLLELIDLRSKTDDYNELTAINSKILAIVYPDYGIAGYYEHLKAQNMPVSSK
ncbi:hypothetical protein KY338_06205 [Candidatus Woesearchaeota archaeon]|nr:hypothetical protein [Candidatus Woesearchaeota archaeon]MBW3005407.1 hypothetical protein [Candidatus Woesearchaeota archaeon]